MILISHRGNTKGTNSKYENHPSYIDNAINRGFEVEIDTRLKGKKIYLGHDYAQYETNLKWLLDRNKKIWIHTKDVNSLELFLNYNLRCFFHESEKHTIISCSDLIWSHDIKSSCNKSIIPLLSLYDLKNKMPKQKIYGICSDFVEYLNNK